LAWLCVLGVALFTACPGYYSTKIRNGFGLAAVGALFLLFNVVLGAFQYSHAEMACVFTFREPSSPVMIEGYIWAGYGLVVGGLLFAGLAAIRKRYGSY